MKKLVALEVGDLGFEPEGVVLTIRRSKTDREGAGAVVAVPLGEEEATCPVGALRRWHGNLGPALSDRALVEIVAGRAAGVGLQGNFAGHSLRAGFATAAARLVGRRPRSCVTALEERADRPATSARGADGTTTLS